MQDMEDGLVMKTIVLPERLDSGMASRLYQQLSDRFGQDLTLDASHMRHLGTLCIQVLLSAAIAWREAKARFEIHGITSEAAAQLAVLGLTTSQFTDAPHDN